MIQLLRRIAGMGVQESESISMKNAKARIHHTAKTVASLLVSVMLLMSSLVFPTLAENTQYYMADGWVLLDPTATPVPSETPAVSETPEQSPTPEPTLTPEGALVAAIDGVTFTLVPPDAAAYAGATLSVERLREVALLTAGLEAYVARYGQEGVPATATITLYRLRLTQNGEGVSLPGGSTVYLNASLGGFTPARVLAFDWQGGAAVLGADAGVASDTANWQTALALTGTDMLMLAGRLDSEPVAETETPEPEATPETSPEASETPEASPEASETPEETPEPSEIPGTYYYEDDAILLTASVTGSLPPDGAWFAVTPADLPATGEAPEGFTAGALLSYRVGFRNEQGELGTEDPLNVTLHVKGAVENAVSLATAQGALLWQRAPEGENTQRDFTFPLQVSDRFVLTAFTPAALETETPTAAFYLYENAFARLTITLPEGVTLPEGAALDADVQPAAFARYADALAAQAIAQEDTVALLDARASFVADGQAVDVSGVALTYSLLLKDDAAQAGTLAAILDGDAAMTPASLTQTPEGTLLSFTMADVPSFGVALALAAQPEQTAYVFENEALRLTVTPPEGVTLPEGTTLTASVDQADWATYEKQLHTAGYDRSRVRQLFTIRAILTLQGDAVDVTGVPLAYTLLFKGAQAEDMLAHVIHTAEAVPAAYAQTEEGAQAAYTAADTVQVGLAVTLPGRTVFLYEDDLLYAIATLSDAGSIPDNATLLVNEVPIDDSLKPYTDMMEQSAPAQSTADEAAQSDENANAADELIGYSFTAYDVRFVVDGQEIEPASGTVSLSIVNKAQQAVQAGDDVRVLHLSEADGGITPKELEATVATEDGKPALQFKTDGFSIILVANGFTMQPPLTYDLIDDTGDMFVNTAFYNDNRVLGVAGNFHLVAFTAAYLNAHTNGNVLARAAYANSNFGTNGIANEVSYIQNYAQVNGTSASNVTHTLVIGSVNTVGLTDNGNAFTINGTKLDKPQNLRKDANTSTLAYVDFNAMASEVASIGSMIGGYANANLTKDFNDMNNRSLTMQSASGLGVYNTTASEMSSISSQPLHLKGFTSGNNGSLILNVNMSGASSVTMPDLYVYVDGVRISANETTTFTTCRVLVNFIGASGSTINMKLANASVLAQGARVNLNQNLNGTVVADTIYVYAESHRDDYVGKVTDNVTVEKVWRNSDGSTMSPIPSGYEAVVQLYKKANSGGAVTAYGSAVTLNAANSFKYTWTGLDKNNYTYFVKEVSVNGVTATGDATSGTAGAFTITYGNNAGITGGIIKVYNKKQAVTSMVVTKVWKDTDGSTAYSGTTPAVTVQLKQNGNAYGSAVTLSSANSYSYTFSDLPKYSSGTTLYTYSIEENPVPTGFTLVGVTYNTDRTTATITNKLTATSVTVTKTWNDTSTLRPAVTLQLMRNGTAVAGKTVTLNGSESPAWSYTFTGLPAGEYTSATTYSAYTYTVTEPTVPTGYTKSESGLNVTNTPETVSVNVTKVWAGDTGYTDYRPASLSLTLRRKLADNTVDTWTQAVTVTAAGGWSASVSGLAKGYYTKPSTTYIYNLYSYYIVEATAPTGYTKAESGLTVTNTFDTTKVKVTKVWQDDANGDGVFETPATTPAVTVQVKDGATVVDSYTFPANATTLTWESKALSKYTKAGALITYTVTESAVAGYTLTNTVYGTYAGGRTATLTNTYQRINIPVTKTWDFSGASPAPTLPQVTYKLYTVANPTGADTPIDTIVVPAGSAASAYNKQFSNLPKYDAGGSEIPYSVTEETTLAYTTSRTGTRETGFTFTNTLNVLSLSGSKTWKGTDGATAYTGYRPAIRINLLQNGVVYDYRDFAAAASGASASYSYSFQNLPRYAPNGDAYTYTVQEPTVAGFTVAVSGANVKNTLLSTSVQITKNWNNNGYTGPLTRPPVTVYLLNGVDKTTIQNPVASYTFPSGAASYVYTFENLPQGYFDAGGTYVPYTYTVQEGPVNGYTASAVTGSAATGFAVTNTLKTVTVSVLKTWTLALGVTEAPAIQIDLLRGGVVIDSVTIPAGAANRSDYAFSWQNLPKTDPATGVDYLYTVEETLAGAAAYGFDTAIDYDTGTANVIAASIHNTQKTVSLTGEKSWKDELGNTYPSELNRPALTVTLYQGANPFVPTQSVTFPANATDYTYSFTNLPRFDANGNTFEYSVRESTVEGFTVTYPEVYGTMRLVVVDITQYVANIQNQLDKTRLVVNKAWFDGGVNVTQTATQPVTVQLTRKAANEAAFTPVSGKTLTLTSATAPKYQGAFENLPAGYVDAGGVYRAYTYSVEELTLTGYASAVGDTDTSAPDTQTVTVTNTRGRIDYSVTKRWLASDGVTVLSAPSGATVTVTLWQSIGGGAASQVAGRSVTLDGTVDTAAQSYESAPWVATFTQLEQFTQDGQAITYSAREAASTNAQGFWVSGASNGANAYTLSNRQTVVRVRKVESITGSALAGASFTIENVSDPTEQYTLAGSDILSDWTQLGLATDTLYRITETVTPAGYLTADPVTFRISGSDGSVYVSTDGFTAAQPEQRVTIPNEPIDLKVVKLDVDMRTVTQAELANAYAGNFVVGAQLTLYAADGVTALGTITASTADQTVYDLDYTKLVMGETYIIKETVTPAGYKTAPPLTIVVGVEANGTIYVLYDDPIPYKTIEVQKTWAQGSTPVDVTFDLTLAGSATILETVVLPAGDADGRIAFAGTAAICVDGKYPMTDSSGAPLTYVITERPIDGYLISAAMTYTEDANTLLGSITNAPTVANFSKKALTGNDELPGAILTLTDITATPATLVETWVSGNAPHEVKGKLIIGHTYTFTETTAPGGYAVTESVSFLVKADGTLEAVGTSPANTTVTAGGVTMRDKQLAVTISKKALSGVEELPGATLTLTDTTLNQEVATWVSASTAKTLSSTVSTAGGGTLIDGLYYTFPAGQSYPLIAGHSYRLSEDAAPAGYLLSDAITFTIALDGSITAVSANGELTGSTLTMRDETNTLQLYKEDADTGARLAGAVFELYEYSDAAPDNLGARVFASILIQTDASGTFTLRGLENGRQYVLREVAAPAGYDLAPDTTFTYLDSQQATPTVSVTVADTRASLRVRKTNPAGQPIAGSTLAIWNVARTVKLWEGVSIAGTPGNPDGWLTVQAEPGQTDAANYLVKGGSYLLSESAAPDGYTLRTDDVPFTFAEGGATALSFMNTPLTLTISKVDIVGSAEIAGATLTLTDDTDGGRLVETWQTAVDGSGNVLPHEVDFTKLRAGHTYTLTEVTAPDGYLIAESVRFTIAGDGTVTLVGTQGEVSGTTVTMTDDRTLLTLLKQGMEGAAINTGVGFSLYQSNAAGDTLAQIGAEDMRFDRLVAGQYYMLVETTVPQGYVAMAPLWFRFDHNQQTGVTTLVHDARADVQVSAANGKATVTLTDAPTDVRVTKTDENGDALAGAVLAIYTDNAGAPGTLVAGTTFTTRIDDPATPQDESIHPYTGVLTQDVSYWLVEESAPEGYALAAPIRFTVGTSAAPVTLTMENKPLTLLLYKLDSDAVSGTGAYTGNPVTGVTLTLTGPYALGGTTEAAHEWSWVTTANPHTLTMADGLVPGGTYTLHEDPATVPEGYQHAADITFTLPAHGGSATYVMVDTPTGLVNVKVTKAFDLNKAGAPLTASELPASVTVRLWRELPGSGAAATEIASRTLTAADNWTYTFSGLVRADGNGTAYRYFVTEDAVPGYTLRVTGDDADPGDSFDYTLYNTANEGEFSKRTLTGDELPGAHMQVLDTQGNLIAEWISTDTPHVLRGVLEPNTTYVLKEVAAPDGYLVTTEFTFTLDANLTPTVTGVTFGGVEAGVVYMVDAATTVTISKQAAGGGAELPGASLTLTHQGAGGTVTDAAWISGYDDLGNLTNAARTIERLQVGVVYTLTETTAPGGYLVAESIQFIIQPDGSVKAKRADEPDSAYQTVDANTVIMLDAPTTVTLSKREVGGGDELPGASVTVTHSDGTNTVVDAQWVSGYDSLGNLTNAPHTIENLLVGVVYTFTETAAPNGYLLAESIHFIIQPDGSVVAKRADEPDSAYQTVNANTVIMEDAPTTVTLSKREVGGGEELPGASVTVSHSDGTGTVVDAQWVSGYDDSGNLTNAPRTFDNLLVGVVYTFTEISAPNGYALAESINFILQPDGSVIAKRVDEPDSAYQRVTANTVIMLDAPTVLTIAKVDEQQPAQIVANAQLSIYTASGADATVPGALVTTVSTGSTGIATVTGQLNMGTWYMVVETATPNGYHTATPSQPFQLGSDGTYQLQMVDHRTVFRVGKQDQDTGALLAGATLVIYASKVENGQLVPDTSAILATIVTENGVTTPVYGLNQNETYFLYEAVAPDGYLRNIDLYEAFTISPDGTTVVYSIDQLTSVNLNKVDANGDRLGGAGMVLVRGDGAAYDPVTDVVASFVSSATADYPVSGLMVDQLYTLLETSAPEGYVQVTTGVTFKLNERGFVVGAGDSLTTPSTVTLISLVNTPTDVVFSKRATGAGTAELPGATLTISHVEGGVTVVDETWVSSGTSHVVRGKLVADGVTEYTFTEVGAPSGYTIAGSIVFRILPNGEVEVKQPDGSFASVANSTVIMTNAPIRFQVAKVDSRTGDYLAGAQFKVVADNAGLPASTAIAGFETIVSGTAPITLSSLAAGDYWLVETASPVGVDANGDPVYYQLAAPVPFTLTDALLDDASLVTVTVEDTPTTVTVLKLDSGILDANGAPTGNRVAGATLILTRKADGAVLGTHTFDGVSDWLLDGGLLEPGQTYVLTETPEGTPPGYLTAGAMEFTLAMDGTGRWIVVNTPIGTREIVVNKVWNDTLTTHSPVTVELYRSDNAATPYRTAVLASPGFTASFTGLPTHAQDGTPYGSTLAEVTAAGYLPGVFTGPVTVGATSTYTLTNTPTDIYINKLAGDTGDELAGASLTLVRGNGTSYTPADVVDTWVSGSDGVNASGVLNPHRITGKVSVGEQYTLIETAAPAGYVRAANITFTVNANGTLSVTGTNRLTMTDSPVTVRFVKLDNLTLTPVAGASFSVYLDAQWQANPQTAQPVFTFVSQTTPVEAAGLFTAGTLYRLVETAAPDGYQRNGASLQFAAPSDGTIVTIQMKNPRLYRFAKVSSTTGAAVAGATLTVTDALGNTVIAPWVSTNAPYEFVNSDASGNPILQSGVTYRLTELVAPTGYVLNTTPVTFTLDSLGLIGGGVTVSMSNVPDNPPEDDTVDLFLRKTWRDNNNAGNTRPATGLTVYISRRASSTANYDTFLTLNIPARAGNNWYLNIYGLPRYNSAGAEYEYRAREEVPAGYTVTYTNNGFTMVNTYPTNDESPTPTPIPTLTPTPQVVVTRIPTIVRYVDGEYIYIDDEEIPLGVVPKTGDDTDFLLWGMAIALPLLLAMAAGIILFRKKRREARKGTAS